MYDTIIIGGGPAGLSAAIYLARKRLKILLILEELGGQMAKASSIENYPGISKISGIELAQKMAEQTQSLEVETKTEAVESVAPTAEGFSVKSSSGEYEAKTIIVTSGKTHRHLGVPGEKEFAGKGVSYCATCDGPLFHDKIVTVVGGGNSALDAALEIAKYAKKVYIICNGPTLQCDAIMQEKFLKLGNGELICAATTTEIFGDPPAGAFVKGLKYKDKEGNIQTLTTDGIFVEIGWVPSTDMVKDLVKINNLGEIEIDAQNKTSTPGLYAAGDVTNTPYKQIVIAAGEGAKAALSTWQYLITTNSKH